MAAEAPGRAGAGAGAGPVSTPTIDAGQIQQALTNLVVNAIQAMPAGGRLRASSTAARPAPPPGSARRQRGVYARLMVTDEGAGIPPELVSRVFEPFFTTKDVGEGTGLGLSVAYGIARDHGGWIEVESAAGRGSRFALFLPVTAPGGEVAA